MRRNDDGGILGDIACRLFRTVFDDETAESTEEHLFPITHILFDGLHERFDDIQYILPVHTGPDRYFLYYFCFCHNL